LKTTAIIFSKNRTLQLKSLLLSLRYYSDFPEECINVIYKTEDDIDYRHIIDNFKCKFIRQNNFLEDIRKIVRESDVEYFWFMVDDLIYMDHFSVKQIESYLDAQQDIDSFCLRLGRNITTKGRQPDFIREEGGFLVWDTQQDQGKHWNYFWEISSSIYRKNIVVEYLSKCRPDKENFPNPFEYHYYASMPNTRTKGFIGVYLKLRHPLAKTYKRVACFENSKCFTHGINLVAELDDKNRKEFYSFKDLHDKMLQGYIVDFISPIKVNSPNPGSSLFKLVNLEFVQQKMKK